VSASIFRLVQASALLVFTISFPWEYVGLRRRGEWLLLRAPRCRPLRVVSTDSTDSTDWTPLRLDRRAAERPIHTRGFAALPVEPIAAASGCPHLCNLW